VTFSYLSLSGQKYLVVKGSPNGENEEGSQYDIRLNQCFWYLIKFIHLKRQLDITKYYLASLLPLFQEIHQERLHIFHTHLKEHVINQLKRLLMVSSLEKVHNSVSRNKTMEEP
jgi:hypothetical protein